MINFRLNDRTDKWPFFELKWLANCQGDGRQNMYYCTEYYTVYRSHIMDRQKAILLSDKLRAGLCSIVCSLKALPSD